MPLDAYAALGGSPIGKFPTSNRLGDPPVLVAASNKIRKELGWTPKYSRLDDILDTAWEWHVSHPAGYPLD